MRSADRRLPIALAAVLAAAIVLAAPGGLEASRAKVGKVTQNNESGLTINGSTVQGGQKPDLYTGDLVATEGDTIVEFKLKLGSTQAECDVRPGPASLSVAPHSSVLLRDNQGKATCTLSSKGGKPKRVGLGKSGSLTSPDPVFEMNVTRRGVEVKVQRGVAVVSGRKASVVVALNGTKKRLARRVFVPAGGNPRRPTIASLTKPEQATFAKIASKLPPVTDVTPPVTTLRERPPDPTVQTSAFFSFGGGAVSACSIDRGPFYACTSPQKYVLLPGRHTFAVRPTDDAGNTGAAVTYTWTIQKSMSAPIVFESNRVNPTEFQVYRINPDGTGTQELTMPPGQSFDPAWSPDGRQIVFESNRATNGRSQIFVMDANGLNERRLTVSPLGDRFPKWSPDGTQIVFEGTSGKQSDIYVMNADGSNRHRLTRSAGINADPVWSPDGSQIAFDSTRSGQPEIWVMGADGSNPQQLTTSPTTAVNPAWSPDGQEIAFESTTGGTSRVYVMDSDGSNPLPLDGFQQDEFHPAWSPDGSELAFAAGHGHDTELQIVPRDGSSRQVLTRSAGQNLVPNW